MSEIDKTQKEQLIKIIGSLVYANDITSAEIQAEVINLDTQRVMRIAKGLDPPFIPNQDFMICASTVDTYCDICHEAILHDRRHICLTKKPFRICRKCLNAYNLQLGSWDK